MIKKTIILDRLFFKKKSRQPRKKYSYKRGRQHNSNIFDPINIKW
jgi:hypothetical protein